MSTERIYRKSPCIVEFSDDTLGLVYYNYRHYEPITGRWLSRDPIEEKGGVSLFVFTANNPLCLFDILGGKWKTENIVIGDIPRVNLLGMDYHYFKEFPDKGFADALNTDCDCVASLLVMSHGNVDALGVSIIDGSESVKVEDASNSDISDLFKGIFFCKKCFIEIRSCFLGKSSLLVERLKRNTGCTITLYPDPVDTDGVMRDPLDDKKQ